MTYVMAVIAALSKQNKEVVLKARGQAISTAVDVTEICRNRYLKDLVKPLIEIGTEELENQYGGKRNVSTMSITLSKEAEKVKKEIEKKPEKKKEISLDKETSLESITGVGVTTAQKLRTAGYSTIDKVASADPDELSEKTGISNKISIKIIDAAKNM
jgi:DNA-binding protein